MSLRCRSLSRTTNFGTMPGSKPIGRILAIQDSRSPFLLESQRAETTRICPVHHSGRDSGSHAEPRDQGMRGGNCGVFERYARWPTRVAVHHNGEFCFKVGLAPQSCAKTKHYLARPRRTQTTKKQRLNLTIRRVDITTHREPNPFRCDFLRMQYL